MELTTDIKRAICSLFEVHDDEHGVQRIVTPLEYSGSGDRIVIRVRPRDGGYLIVENGDAALCASMAGGDVESDSVGRWSDELKHVSPVLLGDDEVLRATANDPRLIAPYVFRVAEAAQQLHAIATSRAERQSSNFRDLLSDSIKRVATELHVGHESDVALPITGGLKADHVLAFNRPMIIVAATSATRLLEAEVMYMQYRAEQKQGFVLAVAGSQASVGKTQFERAAYFTDRTVVFDNGALRQMIHQSTASLQ